jgi:hypothetical protein
VSPVKVSIKGIQKAQAENLRRIAALKPGGELPRAVQMATVQMHRYAVAVTHVDTGSLRASHRITMLDRGLTGRIDIDPFSVNPWTNQIPHVYGVHEHNRGGDHAFYTVARLRHGRDVIKTVARRMRLVLGARHSY